MHKKLSMILLFVFFSVPQTAWFCGALPALAETIVDTAWVRRYNGLGNGEDAAWDIAGDDSGNVYVTGKSYGGATADDYLTIKYAPDGTELWAQTYNGAGDPPDEARALAVDDSGNVYVAGSSGTIKYDAGGNEVWILPWGGVDIALDKSNNVYVTGGGLDYVTIKYYPDGETAWVRTYDGPGNGPDKARSVAIDDSGNVYVTGWSVGSGTYDDYATIKYYPNGDTAWVRRYNGAGNWVDWAYDLAVDDSGNVYVTGALNEGGTDQNYGTIKYYPDGVIAWVRKYDGGVNSDDEAVAITMDVSGNVYISGMSVGMGWDYATIKYYPNGDTAWLRRYDGPANDWDWSYDIAVDDSGNVYVTGFSQGTGTFWDYTTIRYDPNGDIAWVETYDGPKNSYDAALAIAVDDFGNVYVTGFSEDIGTGRDYATIKYVQTDALRGDANGDWVISSADIVYLINYLFVNGPAPDPLWVGDANSDGVLDIADVVYLINYLFAGGPPPSG
ncbi:MAG: SBBP repeat-containing protein [Candidatus Zixiibacteriota bacterium]